MENPNKLEVGQIWKYIHPMSEEIEKHIISKEEVDSGLMVCENLIRYNIEDLGKSTYWHFYGYEQIKVAESNIVKIDKKIIPLVRKDKVQILNGTISLSRLVEMTDEEVDEEFKKLCSVTTSQFEVFKSVARVLVNTGVWDGIDFNFIESELNIEN